MLIKAFLLLCLLAGVIHGLTESNPGTDNEFEACWERCYQVSITREVLYRKKNSLLLINFSQKADESTQMRHYQLAYAGLYDMGMEARRLKNLRSVNGTVILMDGTLHMHHNPSHNANLMESETVNFISRIFFFNFPFFETFFMENIYSKHFFVKLMLFLYVL